MTSSPPRPPFQPTSKAPSTAQSSQLLAVAGQTPATSRTPSRARESRASRPEVVSNDFTSEKATSSLIWRVLIPENSHGSDSRASPPPIGEVLPPLTSSNEVDVELYAILSIVVKDFVNTWYSKITPDHAFVDEVIQIIAHCTRALEQRLRQIDSVQVALDEIPVLIERHVFAYKTAKVSQAAVPYGSHPRQIYHALNPHPALVPSSSPEQQSQTEAVYRQLLVQGALAALLPTEDLQNACLRTLVNDIIADLILGRALGERICESWFLHDAASKIVAVITARTKPKVTSYGIQADAKGRLQKFGLLSSKSKTPNDYSPRRRQSSLNAWFWRVLQYGYLTYLALRFILLGMMHARHLPSRAHLPTSTLPPPKTPTGSPKVAPLPFSGTDRSSRLVLAYRVFPSVSTLLDLSTRMPWFTSALSFWNHVLTSGPVRLAGPDSRLDKFGSKLKTLRIQSQCIAGGRFNGRIQPQTTQKLRYRLEANIPRLFQTPQIDQFLHSVLEKHVFAPFLFPPLLQSVRAAIFPGNAIGPPALPSPSTEEALRIRRRAAEDILSVIPNTVAKIYFATGDHEEMIQQLEEDVLDVFSDTNMNKHLIYGILELIVVRLVPELGEKTPSELLSDRGVNIEYGEKEIL